MRISDLFHRATAEEEPTDLTRALHAGGERAERAVAFLANQMADIFRAGGEPAIEVFSDWMNLAMEANEETATLFYAKVLPMLPADSRKQVLARHGIDADGASEGSDDPLLQNLAAQISVGGTIGAKAVISIYNALRDVKSEAEAQVTIKDMLGRLPARTSASITSHLPTPLRKNIT